MSLQVCHCGWSKVTTYHGLRTHQGRKGCTPKGMGGAVSEQQNMGNFGLPNYQQDLWLDIYTSLKIDTTVDYTLGTSLQVCHCGWTQVTTYQGLRTHQGKMGCAERGVRGAESGQQNMWGTAGLQNKQQDLSYTSVKTDTNAGCSSETSLQVCHCGWKEMTTYKGLRIHQGKKGCTPKGMRIPETEQHYWKNHWEDVNQKKHQPAKKVIIKKEDVPSPPRIDVRTKSASLTAAPIKEEYEASAIPHRSASLSSPQSPVVRPKRKERKDKTSPQVAYRGAVTGYAAKAATIKKEPHTPAVAHRYATLHELPTSDQVIGSIREPPKIYSIPAAARPQEKSIQVTIKQEPHTPLAIPQQPLQTATNSKSGHELCDSSSVQVNKSVRERPTPSPQSAVVRPKKKEGKDQTSLQVNRSLRERPTIPPRPPVVPPKKVGKHQTSPQMCAAKAMQEKLKSELEMKIHMREEKLQKKAEERVCENVPDSTITTNQTNSAAADAVTKENPKTSSKTVQDSNFSTDTKVKQLALMFSATTKKTAAVQRPKEKHQEEQKLPQARTLFLAVTAQEKGVQEKPQEKHQEEGKLPKVTPLAQKFLAATVQETAVQPKEQDREPMPDSTSATTKMNPTAAETTRQEEPKSQCQTAQLRDFSTGLKVKQLAWMFSDTTHKTAVRPKEKLNEERKPAQDKQEKPKSDLEQIIQMKEEKMSDIRAVERACENVPDSTITTTHTNSAAADAVTKDDPILLSKTVQDSDFSTGIKVKQLALMFSATTKKTAAVQRLKEKHQEEQKLPQAAKPWAQKFLAATAQETAVQRPREKHQEEGKLPKVTPLAQKFLAATVQETAVQTKEQDREDQKPEPMPDSRSATTKMNPAAAEDTQKEDPILLSETAQDSDFSNGMKVKQLALMFSATTKKTAAIQQPKEKHQEEQKLPQMIPDSTSATTTMNPAATEATTKQDPKALTETVQLPDCSTGLKVKQLALMFSATNQETAAQLREKHQEERKPAQVKPFGQKLSATTAQETAKGEEMDDQKLSQNATHQPLRGSLDCRPMETNGELSKVMEDARQKSLDLKMSNGSLRNTKPSSNDRHWITKFAVDVKLDPTTAHRCLISSDGKKVRDERETNVADSPKRSDLFGSVLGLNRFTSWKSYWEVEVSNKTGWDLGVARGDANRKGKLLLSPDDGYWAIVHFKNKEYAALTSPPLQLLLKENIQKLGVFVDYEEGLVSFYNVTANSHIYSFTPCSFTGEIVPYFSLDLGDASADPLIISTVKHQ